MGRVIEITALPGELNGANAFTGESQWDVDLPYRAGTAAEPVKVSATVTDVVTGVILVKQDYRRP